MNQAKESNFASVVAYLHDNEADVEPFLRCVCGEIAAHFAQFEIIFVNDASRDGGPQAVKRFQAAGGAGAPVTLVNMSIYQGVELCMNAGIDLAIGDFVFEFDTLDVSYEEGSVFRAYQTALKGYDIVSVRPEKNRTLTSGLFYRVFNRFSGSKYKIGTDMFRVLSRRAINRVRAVSATPVYRKAAYAASGLRLCSLEMPLPVGGTDANKPLRFSLAMDSLALYTDAGYRLSVGVALLMLAGTLVELFYTLTVYLGGGQPIEGWTTTMLVLTLGFFGVFLILAIVLKYLSLLVDLVFRHQKYLVDSVEKL